MIALASFLVIVTLYLLIERTATVALTLTGLSRDAALFQARSAFTGTGFTTEESEYLVRQPVRRQIVALLMLLRSVGTFTAIPSLVLTFLNTAGPADQLTRVIVLVVGLSIMGLLATSPWIDGHLSRCIAWALCRWTRLDARDYTALLGLAGGHAVLELEVTPESWLAGRRLDELELPEEGVLVLGIQRADGSFVGAPRGRSTIRPYDTLILYGQVDRLAEIEARVSGPVGDEAHREAVLAQQGIFAEQDRRDRVHGHLTHTAVPA
jgi:hypothetical protein